MTQLMVKRLSLCLKNSSSSWVKIDKDFALRVYKAIRLSTIEFQAMELASIEEGDTVETSERLTISVQTIDTADFKYNFDDLFEDSIERFDTQEILRKASDVLMILFGCTLMIVGESE